MKKSLSKQLFSLAKTPLGDFVVGLAFGKFSKFLPVKKIKETNKVIAFWHLKPFWEKHILIVPKKPIKSLTLLKPEEMVFVNEVFNIAKELVKELNWEKDGYTLSVNGGKTQEINQLHFHLHSGKKIGK